MTKLWKVERIDRNKNEHWYKLHVEGIYTEACGPQQAGQRFSWSVAAVDTEDAYDISDAYIAPDARAYVLGL